MNQNTLRVLPANRSNVVIVILQVSHTVMECEQEVFMLQQNVLVSTDVRRPFDASTRTVGVTSKNADRH